MKSASSKLFFPVRNVVAPKMTATFVFVHVIALVRAYNWVPLIENARIDTLKEPLEYTPLATGVFDAIRADVVSGYLQCPTGESANINYGMPWQVCETASTIGPPSPKYGIISHHVPVSICTHLKFSFFISHRASLLLTMCNLSTRHLS